MTPHCHAGSQRTLPGAGSAIAGSKDRISASLSRILHRLPRLLSQPRSSFAVNLTDCQWERLPSTLAWPAWRCHGVRCSKDSLLWWHRPLLLLLLVQWTTPNVDSEEGVRWPLGTLIHLQFKSNTFVAWSLFRLLHTWWNSRIRV